MKTGTEHHFTDYSMIPNPRPFLAYMVGRTSSVDLGSSTTSRTGASGSASAGASARTTRRSSTVTCMLKARQRSAWRSLSGSRTRPVLRRC